MTWAKLDDQFYTHPKVGALDPDMMPAAVGLHCLALSWCANQLTDGQIPRPQVARLLGTQAAYNLADELVRVGLWETGETGYLIHDYLKYNPTREKILVEREAARVRMQGVRGQNIETCSDEVPPNIARSSTTPVPVPVPVPIPDPLEDSAPIGAGPRSNGRKPDPATHTRPQVLLAWWIDWKKEHGQSEPPKSFKSRIGGILAEQCEVTANDRVIQDAIERLEEKGMGPQLLPSFVNEIERSTPSDPSLDRVKRIRATMRADGEHAARAQADLMKVDFQEVLNHA